MKDPGGLGTDLLGVAVADRECTWRGVWVQEATLNGQGVDAVYEFDSPGSFAGVKLTGSETPAGAFQFATKHTPAFGSAIAVDDSLSLNGGDLYIADTNHHVVDRFSAAGAFICQIAGSETERAQPGPECAGGGSGLTGAMLPAAVAVDSSGDVYVADDKGSQVLEFGPEGALLRDIHNHKGDLSKEMGSIAVDSNGDIYVGGFALPVNELDPQGELIHQLGGRTFAVAVDDASRPNEVYVDELEARKTPKEETEHVEQIAEYEPSGAVRKRHDRWPRTAGLGSDLPGARC